MKKPYNSYETIKHINVNEPKLNYGINFYKI